MVDCALFTIGDYKQKERNGWRYQLGSSMNDGFAWKTLFHKSENLSGFENTKVILNKLLSHSSIFTNDYLSKLINGYIERCENKNEYPWMYYYIKYGIFRPGRYGRYWWNDFDNSPYVFTTLYQSIKLSGNSYNPFLKAVNENVSRDHQGNRIYPNENQFLIESQKLYQVVSCDDNNVFKVYNEFSINQNDDGIDTEDRIKKMTEIVRHVNFESKVI